MKHIMRILLYALLAGCFVLMALTACGGKTDSPNNDPPTQEETLQSNDTAQMPDNSNAGIEDTDEPKEDQEDETSVSTDETNDQQNEENDTSVDSGSEAESFSVIHADDDFSFYARLTAGQREKLANLSAEELPRDVVDLEVLQRDQIWNDLLIPLAENEFKDVTLYGVVDAGWLSEVTQQGNEIINDISNMDAEVLVLRYGEELIVQEDLSWNKNAWNNDPPWLEIYDFDGDGESEIAVCTYAISGMGAGYHQLWIYDMDEKKSYFPDITNLDITVEADWQSGEVTLIGGPYTATATVDDSISEDDEHNFLSYGNIIDFSIGDVPGQHLLCHTSLVWGGPGGYLFADVTAPVIYSDGEYKLGEVMNMTLPYLLY